MTSITIVIIWLALFSMALPYIVRILIWLGLNMVVFFPHLMDSPLLKIWLLLTGIILGYATGLAVNCITNIIALTFSRL